MEIGILANNRYVIRILEPNDRANCTRMPCAVSLNVIRIESSWHILNNNDDRFESRSDVISKDLVAHMFKCIYFCTKVLDSIILSRNVPCIKINK